MMFRDLVGSTRALDAARSRGHAAGHPRLSGRQPGVVALYHRFVAKFMGDSILAYFAFPRAHEDDPSGQSAPV